VVKADESDGNSADNQVVIAILPTINQKTTIVHLFITDCRSTSSVALVAKQAVNWDPINHILFLDVFRGALMTLYRIFVLTIFVMSRL
jgi:hypothetical protein